MRYSYSSGPSAPNFASIALTHTLPFHPPTPLSNRPWPHSLFYFHPRNPHPHTHPHTHTLTQVSFFFFSSLPLMPSPRGQSRRRALPKPRLRRPVWAKPHILVLILIYDDNQYTYLARPFFSLSRDCRCFLPLPLPLLCFTYNTYFALLSACVL